MNEGALKDFLIDAGMLSRAQVDRIMREAEGKPLDVVLLEQGILSEDEIRRERRQVSVLPVRKYRPAGSGDVSWQWLEQRMEHLAVRRDSSV